MLSVEVWIKFRVENINSIPPIFKNVKEAVGDKQIKNNVDDISVEFYEKKEDLTNAKP